MIRHTLGEGRVGALSSPLWATFRATTVRASDRPAPLEQTARGRTAPHTCSLVLNPPTLHMCGKFLSILLVQLVFAVSFWWRGIYESYAGAPQRRRAAGAHSALVHWTARSYTAHFSPTLYAFLICVSLLEG